MTKPVSGDLFGGLTAMLVAVPSAIAYGLLIYAPLGADWSGVAAFSAILGAIVLAISVSALGGSPRLISAPCAPAAAVLSVFVASLVAAGTDPARVPLFLALTAGTAGLVQFLLGVAGGGKIIKYIPYPVVAGYLSGVGVLILIAQVPKVLGAPLTSVDHWQATSLVVGLVTIAAMAGAPRLLPKLPAPVVALVAGITTYAALSVWQPSLRSLAHNAFVVGSVPVADAGFLSRLLAAWSSVTTVRWEELSALATPVLTLAALLAIDTLKTCVVVDVLTQARHDSNKTLVGLGVGNFLAGVLTGVPGAGAMGPTMVNLNSGGQTKLSGVVAGLGALLVVLFLGPAVSWIPVSCLAGILIVLAVRMVDWNAFHLLRHPSTRFDFAVILGVVVAAVASDLLIAAGVGIALAIVLFLREQMRSSVIRRRASGAQVFSRTTRPLDQVELLRETGDETQVVELQGQLFFGTTDKLFTEVEPLLARCRHLILDMRRVQSVDYTAAHLLEQLKSLLEKHEGVLALVSVPQNSPTGAHPRDYLRNLGVVDGKNLLYFADLDEALAWAENDRLGRRAANAAALGPLDLGQLDLFRDMETAAFAALRPLVETRRYSRGDTIFHRGDTGQDLSLILQGTVRIILPLSGEKAYHLATFGRGAFFGDMAFLDSETRSADAVAEDDVVLAVLSRKTFNDWGRTHPQAAGRFFEKLSLVISARLRQSHTELQALQEG